MFGRKKRDNVSPDDQVLLDALAPYDSVDRQRMLKQVVLEEMHRELLEPDQVCGYKVCSKHDTQVLTIGTEEAECPLCMREGFHLLNQKVEQIGKALGVELPQ